MRKLSAKMVSWTAIGVLGLMGLFTLGTETQAQGLSNQNTTYNPDVPGSTALTGDKLITSIKTAINWILGMLSLIALVILLRGGFQMITAAGDDAKYKKGFKILQQAGVGLLFIGVSRLIVSVIFWLLGMFTA